MNPPLPLLPETRFLDCAPDALSRIPETVKIHFGADTELFPVTEISAWNQIGRELYAALKAAGFSVSKPCLLEENNTEEVCGALRSASANSVPVVIGSCELLNRAKILFATRNIPLPRSYFAVLTDLSSDLPGARDAYPGYILRTAVPPPRALVLDPLVLARAPKTSHSAGYCALFSQITAGADALLTEFVTDRAPVSEAVWNCVQDSLLLRTVHPKELAEGDEKALDDLLHGLLATSLSSQLLPDASRLGESSEHLFARVFAATHKEPSPALEIPPVHDSNLTPLFNPNHPDFGHLLALGALCSLIFYIKLFERPFTRADISGALETYPSWEMREALLRNSIGPVPQILAECRAKHLELPALRERLEHVADHWSELREKLDRQIMYFPRMRAMLLCAGAPVTASDIGWDPARMAASAILAQMLSRRYTVLDLAYETGRFAECIQAIQEAFSRDETPCS